MWTRILLIRPDGGPTGLQGGLAPTPRDSGKDWRRAEPLRPPPQLEQGAPPGRGHQQPEGWRGQDDHRRQPRGQPRRRRAPGAPGRHGSPGQRELLGRLPAGLGAGRHLRADAGRGPLRRRGALDRAALAVGRARLGRSRRRRGGARQPRGPRDRARSRARARARGQRLRLRDLRLPAEPGPHHDQRARGLRSRHHPHAGQVLLARGARGAQGHHRRDPLRLQPEAPHRGHRVLHVRPAHQPRAAGGQRGARALRRRGVRDGGADQRAPVREPELRQACAPLRHREPRRPVVPAARPRGALAHEGERGEGERGEGRGRRRQPA